MIYRKPAALNEDLYYSKRANSQRSQAWKYFIKKPGYFATCKLCGNDFSYKGSVSNLTKHCIRKHRNIFNKENNCSDDDFERYFEFTENADILRCKLCYKEVPNESVDDMIKHIAQEHGNDETDAESGTDAGDTRVVKVDAESRSNSGKPSKPTRYRSNVWHYFDRKRDVMARCRLCNNDYSYRASVSNLNKHCKLVHGINVVVDTKYEIYDENDSSLLNERKFSSERYFDVTDDDQVVRCKLCAKEVHQDSVADLIKHIVEEHGHFEDPDTEGGTNAPKTKLLVWLYYKPCADTEIAECLICRAGITYQDSVYSLKEHLETEHPLVKFDGGENGNRLLISADGDLYEVETESSRINHDEEPDQKDPIEMDTVYLEDYDELPDRATRKRPSFNRKKPTISYKMKQSDSFNNYNEDTTKRPSFKRKKRDLNYIKKEPLDNSSSDDGLAANKKLKDTRLELFGQYIISLLKELPKRLSDQLQGDIIKQVITAKGMYEAEKLNVTAPVSVSSVVTAPVTVTGTVPVTESIPVIMCNSDGSIKSIINS